MSKRTYISRYNLILQKLRTKPYSSFEEIREYVENRLASLQLLDDDLKTDFSLRTFQRDKNELWLLYGIQIEYSRKEKGYFIAESVADEEPLQRMMEAFDIFNSLNLAQDLTPFVHLEKRRPQGTENLYGLLHAIKNKFQIGFSYQKFWEDEITKRTAEPYALKEFKNRWYVMAKDNKDGTIKSFALDRLTDLEIANRKFDYPVNYDVEENYRYCFGIINPNNEKPQDIILSFEPFQGKYIKTLPLHHTQEILIDTDEELQIKLKLCITHDFIMELLSYGSNMEVVKPKSLLNKLKEEHKKAFSQYLEIKKY